MLPGAVNLFVSLDRMMNGWYGLMVLGMFAEKGAEIETQGLQGLQLKVHPCKTYAGSL
jgi:hypothetical protein